MAKKLIFNLILVFIVVFVIDFFIGRAIRHYYFRETSGLHYRITYSMELTKADLLVFGSSRANHHYVPEVFEDSLKLTFYNTGKDGSGIFYHTALLQSVLQRYKPKIVILDWSGKFDKNQDSYDRLSALLPYYRTHPEIRNIVELKSRFEKIKLLSEIYPFNSEILATAMGNLEINKQRKSDNKGYIPLYKVWQSEIDSMNSVEKYEVDSTKIKKFQDFIRLAKYSGVKIYIVYSPTFKRVNWLQETEICQKICSTENIPFFDYSKDTFFINSNKFFQDPGHLNHTGALQFSKLLIDRLKFSISK